jgi:hypothetical protein
LETVEEDLVAKREQTQLAASTEAWLVSLRERIAEVEEDTREAFEKRRELVRLLVERITVPAWCIGRVVDPRYRLWARTE